LKITFGDQTDNENLHNLRNTLGDDSGLMADANQSWNLAKANRMVKFFEAFQFRWLESQ
jgi:L-alanine-DL-glutamate epimerase-like enolase superfamily enzyme